MHMMIMVTERSNDRVLLVANTPLPGRSSDHPLQSENSKGQRGKKHVVETSTCTDERGKPECRHSSLMLEQDREATLPDFIERLDKRYLELITKCHIVGT
jgi:hypothetical protein